MFVGDDEMMMSVLGRFVYRWKRMSPHYARSGGSSAIDYARQRIMMRNVYPDGFHFYNTLRSKYRNIGSSELIIPLFSRCAFSTRRSNPEMRQCSTAEELVQLAYDNLDTISHRCKAAFWAALPKLLHRRMTKENVKIQEQLEAILTSTIESIRQFSSRDHSTATLGLAKVMKQVVESHGQKAATASLHRILHSLLIGVNSEKKQFILIKAAKSSVPILPEFDARCLSNLIYSFGLAEYVPKVQNDHTILDVLALEAMSKLHHFNSQDLSNMLWSYAKMESSNSVLFKAAGDSIVGMNDLSEFWPQSLSNIIWAYATAGESHPKLFRKFGDHIVAMKNLGEFKQQELSNIIWAYATAGESHPRLFSKVGDHIVAMKDMGHFKPQDFSNIIWSYATAGELHPQLFKGFGDHIAAMKDMGHFKPQDFSNIALSYAKAGEAHPRLFSKVGDHIVAMRDLSAFLPQHFSNIVWAYATAGKLHPLLFQKLADVAIVRSNDFNLQGIANLLWAYAAVGIIDPLLFTSFAPAVKTVLSQCNSQDLANISWAYAVVNVNDPLLFNTDFMNALQANNVDRFVREAVFQLHQWQLWQDELKSGINLPPALRDKCRQAFDLRLPQPSNFQDDVVSVLSSIGMLPEEEVLTASGYRLDALVEVNGMKVGIEVDGPSHFINRDATGSTLLKRRQVSTLDDICIVSVPYWDWNKLGKDRVKKQQYLRSKLGLV